MVEHQLRPLFGFFEAFTLPTAIYASNKDFPEVSSISQATQPRVAQAAEEAQLLLGWPAGLALVTQYKSITHGGEMACLAALR